MEEDKTKDYARELGNLLRERILKKEQLPRFKRHAEEMSGLLQTVKLVPGPTFERAARQLWSIIDHAEGIWDDAKMLFLRGRHPTACFLAIVCIEECAKVNVGRIQALLSFDDKGGSKKVEASAPKKSANLRSHKAKHVLAASAGALVNSRMDRILGVEKVASFIADCETGALERLRQACLYVDVAGNQLLVPAERITKEKALFYVCLAGEILAEVGGVEPETWRRLLEKVDTFERDNGLVAAANLADPPYLRLFRWLLLNPVSIGPWFEYIVRQAIEKRMGGDASSAFEAIAKIMAEVYRQPQE